MNGITNGITNQLDYGYQTSQSTFIGYVYNNKIFNNYNQQIGVSNEEHKKALDVAKKYEEVLYEKGILERPKTPQELNQEMQDTLKKTQDMMAKMSETILSLNDKINHLESQTIESQTANGGQNNGKQADINERSQQISRTTKGPVSQ